MSDQFFWFATRSAGIVAWFAASASIIVGLLIPTRALGRRPTIPWLTDLHRYFGAMSMVFLAIHMVTLWADSFVQFGLAELFVPFVATVPGLSRWSLALGVIAGWLLFAVEATSLIKDRMPPRAWHTIHLTSYGVLIAGAVHGLEAGSDTDNRYLLAATASVLMLIAMLTFIRVARLLANRKRQFDEEFPDGFDSAWDPYDHEAPYHEPAFVGTRADHDEHDDSDDSDGVWLLDPDVPITSGARLVDTDPGPASAPWHRDHRVSWSDDDEQPSWLRPPER